MTRNPALRAALLALLALALAGCGSNAPPGDGYQLTNKITAGIDAPGWKVIVNDSSNPAATSTLLLRPDGSTDTDQQSLKKARNIRGEANRVFGSPRPPNHGEELAYLEISVQPTEDSVWQSFSTAAGPSDREWRTITGVPGESQQTTAYRDAGDQTIVVTAIEHGSPSPSAVELLENMVRGEQIRFGVRR